MSFNLLFEMAAAIGTQRMVELCEHYLWITDTQRWSDSPRSTPQSAPGVAFWSDCSGAAPPVSPITTPPRAPRTAATPGAPQRPRAIFNSPPLSASPPPVFDLSGADGAATEVVDLTLNNCVMCGVESSGAPPYNLGAIGPTCGKGCYDASYDAPPPVSCDLHGGGAALGYSRNSWGDYSTFAPLCSCPAPLGPAHNTSWEDTNRYIIETLEGALMPGEELRRLLEQADRRGLSEHPVVVEARSLLTE